MIEIEKLRDMIKEQTEEFELRINTCGKLWHGEVEYITEDMEEEVMESFYNHNSLNELIEDIESFFIC